MASPPGGQYLFTANSGATPVNLVLTANGTTDLQGGALAGDTISGAFNLEVFVGPSNPGGATTGYQASAFAPGATVLNGFLVTPSVGGSLHFNGGGPLAVTDYGFADSIFGGTANDTIHAGVKDTIIGGASSVGSLVIDATKIVNAAASVGGSDLVALGGAASTVYAAAASGAADTVNAGSGTGVVTFGTSGLTLQGAAAGTTYAIADTAGGALSGGALHISVGGSAGDTISLLPGNASVTAAVNALAGSEQVNLGAGAAAVYAVAGDTINAGAGIGTLTFGPAAA